MEIISQFYRLLNEKKILINVFSLSSAHQRQKEREETFLL